MTRTTRTARIGCGNDGIVTVEILEGFQQSLADARENISAAVALAAPTRRPVLVNLLSGEPLEPEVRHFYSGSKMGEAFAAIAILVPSSAFGRMMGNIYLRISNPGIPIQLFHSDEEARSWLRGFRSD
ncbi:MAG: DUF7793 family protein [Bdellovibrionota bacterium]